MFDHIYLFSINDFKSSNTHNNKSIFFAMSESESLNSKVVDYLIHIPENNCRVVEIMEFLHSVDGCEHTVYYDMDVCEIQDLFWKNNEYIQLTQNGAEIAIILADKGTKQMKVFEGREGRTIREQDQTGLKENYILNLSFDGRRWEGSLLNDIQFGYGFEFDTNGLCCYEGFSYGSNRVCYGIIYDDMDQKEYEGGLVNGKRFGYGEIRNRRNELDYSGMLLMGSQLDNARTYPITHSHLDEIVWPELTDTIQTIQICNIPTIKDIYISSDTFGKLQVFRVENMPSIRSVVVNDNCGIASNGDCFIIKNCRRLENIQVGSSFTSCNLVEISQCASITRIEVREQAFMICHKILFESR